MNMEDKLVRLLTKKEEKENLLRELEAIESRIRVKEREHAWEMAKLRKKREEIQKMISEALTTGRDVANIHKDATSIVGS